MGLEINSLLRTYGLNGIELQNKPSSVSFRQNSSDDKFESNLPERFANEAVITKLVNTNPKIQSILKEVGVEPILNFQDLKPLLNNHCTDVRNISSGIVQNLPFSLRNFVDEKAILDASYLHDIGKVLIPSEILNKQGKLNETETKIMHKHSELSYEILKNTNLDKKTLNLIRNHHQNAKKSGYPFVPKDFRADLNLQILTMADKYSALTEKRPYKEAFTPKQALTIIYADVKDGKLHPFVFKALANYVNDTQTANLQLA